MARHVDYHLAHARAVASGATGGAQSTVKDSADGLARVLLRLHAERFGQVAPRALAAQHHVAAMAAVAAVGTALRHMGLTAKADDPVAAAAALHVDLRAVVEH